MTSFRVDDVSPAKEPLPTVRLAEVYADALALGGDPDTPVIEPDGVHPLLDAVARAFAGHRWLELAAHAGREALVREVFALPKDANGWRELIDEFGKEVAARAEGADLFECDFTTSTEVERTTGRVSRSVVSGVAVRQPDFVWESAVCASGRRRRAGCRPCVSVRRAVPAVRGGRRRAGAAHRRWLA